ncbi:heavy-metal-associated domain-containing protein [Halolamina sp. C58]|uniref:heavy-metal-associated domain-containing protein n=1 Tax=Halolamina sp. C58 TaxID=3421640 RepID=UPI003EBA4B7E
MARTITVEGMTCGHCEETVEEALENVDGVTAASADRDAESATVEGTADSDALVDAVDDAGYDASA